MPSTADSRETWVHEKGLPRVCSTPLAAHLGRHLLLATDLTAASRSAEARALDLAERIDGATLLVLAVNPPATADRETIATRVGDLVARARERGIESAGRARVGDPGAVILDVAAAARADTIIVGADAWHSPLSARCVSGHAIRHAPCQVLVVDGTRA